MAAFANAALHVPLQRRDDVALLETKVQKVLDDETEHDRRTAHERYRVVHIHRDARLLEQGTHHADVARVAGAGAVNSEIKFRPALLPHLQVLGVHQRLGVLGPVEDLHVLELVTVGKDVDNGGTQRDQTDTPGDDDDVLAVVRFHRKPVAKRPPERKLVTRLVLLERVGADPYPSQCEEGLPFRRGRRKRQGEFTLARNRHQAEHARAEGREEPLLILGVLKVPLHRLDLGNLVVQGVDDGYLGQIDILGLLHCLSLSVVARRIISTTLGIPMSPWHTIAQRPQPMQATDSSRWMK